jgi:PAS domain S-box-containing protein
VLYDNNDELELIQEKLQIANTRLEERVQERTIQLKEKEIFLYSIIEQSPVSTWIADAHGTMILVNDACLKLYGVESADQGVGKYNIFEDDTLKNYHENIRTVFTEGKVLKFTLEYNVKNVNHVDIPTGVPVIINTTIFPIKNSEGIITNVVIQSEDITKRKIAEQEKDKFNKELIKINNDLDNFVYTASHDLKAPISNIEGLVTELKQTMKKPSPQREDEAYLLALIERSILRFKATIQDLTEISKVQRNFNEEVEELDLQEVIGDVMLTIGNSIVASDAVVCVDVSAGRKIKFSKINLNSIIYNLLSNAIKYRSQERKPEVRITAVKLEKELLIEVSDNGLGIKEVHIDKLFSMFKRFYDHVEGTGVGLYIVKRIVENSGGKIEVTSKEGKGSVFSVYLKDPEE